jgi:hypothetical protein
MSALKLVIESENLVWQGRPRSNQTHRAEENVPQLGKFIDTERP